MDRILTLTKSKLDNLLDAAYNRGYTDAKYNSINKELDQCRNDLGEDEATVGPDNWG